MLIAPDVQSLPDTTWYVTRKDTVPVPLILAAPDEGWARGMMDELTRRDNDARLLLAHIRAQDAELARLRDALGKVCDAAMEGYGTTCCTLCYDWTVTAEGEFHHAPDCPVDAARRTLEWGA